MAPLKVYVATASANPETKYRVQRTLMILDGLGIPFDSIDITKPEKAEERRFMRENAHKDENEPRGPVLPPQFFYNDEYLGDYEDFDTSVEEDTITQFLRLLPDTMESNANNNSNVQEEEENTKTDVNSTVDGATKSGEENEEDEDEQWDEDEEWEDEDEEENEQKTEKEAEKKDEISPKVESEVAKKEEEEENAVDEELEGEDEEWEDEEEIE